MSHTDLCRGGHNVKKYLDEVESYLNIEKVAYPDNVQSEVILKIHTFSFPVTAGDKLCFIVLPFGGSPIALVINGQLYIPDMYDIDWAEASDANFIGGKFLTPPYHRCTGLKLTMENYENLELKACRQNTNLVSLLGDRNQLIFGTTYKYSYCCPAEYYIHADAFSYDFYSGNEYNAGTNGVFKFIFDPSDRINMYQRQVVSEVLSFPALSGCIPNYTRYTPSLRIDKHFLVYYECNLTETLSVTVNCRYELLNGTRELRSDFDNQILKHFIDRNKHDPHNFNRVLNFVI